MRRRVAYVGLAALSVTLFACKAAPDSGQTTAPATKVHPPVATASKSNPDTSDVQVNLCDVRSSTTLQVNLEFKNTSTEPRAMEATVQAKNSAGIGKSIVVGTGVKLSPGQYLNVDGNDVGMPSGGEVGLACEIISVKYK